jgi:hypothetical protein
MAPHLSALDRSFLLKLLGQQKSPVDIHKMFVARRARQGKTAQSVCNLRKALKGLTYKQGFKETRGRKRI